MRAGLVDRHDFGEQWLAAAAASHPSWLYCFGSIQQASPRPTRSLMPSHTASEPWQRRTRPLTWYGSVSLSCLTKQINFGI